MLLYGCGDFLNDYEGIGGYDSFRGDLALMYFPVLDPSNGNLLRLSMIPTQTRSFRIGRPRADDVTWSAQRMHRECSKLGARVVEEVDGTLTLEW